jgi:hypothetical protein
MGYASLTAWAKLRIDIDRARELRLGFVVMPKLPHRVAPRVAQSYNNVGDAAACLAKLRR